MAGRQDPRIEQLRRWALDATLFAPEGKLEGAIERLGFVQADPIRAPARAQDLILRHRVADYRAGDLEARYPELDCEEDYLYCHGFAARRVAGALHPKPKARLTGLQRRVLDAVEETGETHPAALEARFGPRRARNPWGGYSKATTQALAWLHYHGLVRVARREKGLRVYAPTRAREAEPLPRPERDDRLAAALLNLFAPLGEASVGGLLNLVRAYARVEPARVRTALARMVEQGTARREEAGGAAYLVPARLAASENEPAEPRVRILAPFDPIVWDRRRVEHLWGWAYRFEAYTPPAKRTMGYYAMPLLWGSELVGWVNATPDGEVEPGYRAGKAPAGRAFRSALEAEVASLKWFLARPAASAKQSAMLPR